MRYRIDIFFSNTSLLFEMIYYKDLIRMIRPTLRVTLTLQCGQNIEEYKCSLYSLFDGYEKKITTYQS